jgi:hypothetical protein
MANVNEHRVEFPVAPAAAGKPAAALPETWLNRFVHVIASMERAGNALGTMAFTWATVVLLGGYPTVLGQDFWFATAIIFLEAFRYVLMQLYIYIAHFGYCLLLRAIFLNSFSSTQIRELRSLFVES